MWKPSSLLSGHIRFHLFHPIISTVPYLISSIHPVLILVGALHAQRLVEENPDAFMDPSGFIYHETRCGSTLTANMIASIPSNIVHRYCLVVVILDRDVTSQVKSREGVMSAGSESP